MEDQTPKVSEITEKYENLLKEHRKLKEKYNIERKRADKLEEVIKLNNNEKKGNNNQTSADKSDPHPKMENNDIGDAVNFVKPGTPSNVQVLPFAPTEKYAAYYNMNNVKRGKAIIFNHENFKIKNIKAERRDGTNVDCKNLKSTLEELGFEVTDYYDQIRDEIIVKLKRFASLDHSQHDCLVVAFLTHGDPGKLYAYDKLYESDIVWSFFTSDKCPSLAGKPKLFFIQACQGKQVDGGLLFKEKTRTDGSSATTSDFRIPIHADFLIVYSTIPGFSSWRDPGYGTWFIQSLCMELRENGTRYDILTLLTFVVQRIAIDFESYDPDDITKHEKKQIPCTTSMLTRLVKFTPRNGVPLETNAIGNSKNIHMLFEKIVP